MGSVFTQLAVLESKIPGGEVHDRDDNEEELKDEEIGHGGPASVGPLVSTLMMAAAETPLESDDKGGNLVALLKDKDKEFKEIMNEAKKYNALAKEGNPAQRALRTERSPEVKENPAQRALQTERSPEVKENPAQRALQTERSPEVKVNVKKAVQEEFKGLVDETIYNFYGLTEDEEMINALPDEPEFYEVETTLDTGASAHAANRVDFPGYEVVESPGSKAGQHFGCAGGKSLLNEGQMTVHMVSPLEETAISLCTQVTQVTRPLLSVTKMTEDGKLEVLCRRDKAVVRDLKGKILATFPKKNGLYVCMMKVKNPRYRHNQPFPRPLP